MSTLPTHYVRRGVDTSNMQPSQVRDAGFFDYELELVFDEWMDENLPMVKVGTHTLRPSLCLKEADPASYREDFNNWLGSEGFDESSYQ